MPTSTPPTHPSAPVAEAASAATFTMPSPPRRISRRREISGRRPALTLEAIVDAAIDVLDEAGVVGLSMRRVAERLDTGAASLYAHVSGKDELLELVFDELVGRVPLPDPDPSRWREQLGEMLHALRDTLASHRDAALAGLGRVPTSPKILAAAEVLTEVLRAGGLSDEVVVLGFDQLILYVSACAFEAGLYEFGGMSRTEIDRYFSEAHAFYAALPPERFPVLASLGPHMAGHDAEKRFDFGIRVLIAGLEAVGADR